MRFKVQRSPFKVVGLNIPIEPLNPEPRTQNLLTDQSNADKL